MAEQPKNLRIIRRKEVTRRTGKARTTLYADIAAGTFPKPIKIGPRASGWIESEVDAWIEQRIDASRKACGEPV